MNKLKLLFLLLLFSQCEDAKNKVVPSIIRYIKKLNKIFKK